MFPHTRTAARAALLLSQRRRAPTLLRSFAVSTDATLAHPLPSPPLRVAVVGSGPAGMYVTSSLLKQLGEAVRVDVIVSW